MQYEGQICRSPMERGAFMLPVTVGCAYNQCRFCTLFKHLSFRVLPTAQIEQELCRVQQMGGQPKRIFLGDGSAFQLEAGALAEILRHIRTYFPYGPSVRMDATVTSIAQKTDAELAFLHELGVEQVYLGIESGLADVLQFMHKDHSPQQAKEQISRLHRAGIDYAAHIMTGVAGKGRGAENARATADFLNRTKPVSVTNFSMFLHRQAPLQSEIECGRFSPADELENLQEARLLISQLEQNPLLFEGFHDMLSLRVRGTLPRDREKLLSQLDQAIVAQQGKPPVYAWIGEGFVGAFTPCSCRIEKQA